MMSNPYICRLVGLMFLCVTSLSMAANVILQNNSGIRWVISEQEEGYAFGSLFVNDDLAEASLTKGVIRFINTDNENDVWFYASKCEQVSPVKAVLSGSGHLDGTKAEFTVTAETPNDVQAVKITYDFSVNKDISNRRACLLYNTDFNHPLTCHLYPWVEDSKWIKRDPLTDMGIPSLILYRDDRSLAMMWGIDLNFDYLNPTSWTGDFGLYFTDGVLPAQWRIGDGILKKDIDYHCPMQIVFSQQTDPDEMIIDLVRNWIDLNDYRVEPLNIRSNDEALDIYIEGRENNVDAWQPGKGYSLHGATPTFIYMGVQGMAAYFDYMLFELTGDSLWRQRAFEQMDFIAEGQDRNPLHHNYGAVHTTYTLTKKYAKNYGPSPQGWNSDDRWNIGYKPDIDALLARYMLKMWKLLKDHEGIDRQDWYKTAKLAIDWITRQQNNDGGLPQKVQIEPIEERWFDDEHGLVIQPYKSRSSTSGRALPAFSYFSELPGDAHYKTFMEELEKYHLKNVQNKYYFTSHHPDLPPYEFEEASIWGVCEYWLNRYDETGNKEYLKHAVANGYLAFTWWCPKQLSWVDNPTQGGSAEQLHYLQYSVYNYQCRKIECLRRLFDSTGNVLFGELYERMLQNIYFTQNTEGIDKGGTYERIADPWLARGEGFNSLGVFYSNEQALDCFVQIFEMYRTGKDFYMGEGITIKVYPDGICYYSRSIEDQRKVNLRVCPSRGSIRVDINKWEKDQKSWIIKESTEPRISTTYSVGDLKPNLWVQVEVNGDEIGKYQANSEGMIYFSYTGNLEKSRTFKVY